MIYEARFTVTNMNTGRSYEVLGPIGSRPKERDIEMVWLGEKCWFMSGTKVRITDSEGNSMTFVKEAMQ